MIGLRFFLACAIALLAMARAAAAEEKPVFPVMAWDMAPSDAAQLAKMKECGINIAGFATISQLDAIHAARMRAILSDARTRDYDWAKVDAAVARKNVESLLADPRVKDHPAVFGFHLRDEPQAQWFEGLEKVASVIREKAPGKWAYINLFPNYAEPWQLGTKSYEAYLEKFVATCKPAILSYDHYALREDGSLGGEYFKNLEQMRGASVKHRIPFWSIVLAVAHFSNRQVRAEDFRFQAYTTLAYGGRGIAYFKYFTPAVGNYRGGPVDQFGDETPAWGAMRSANKQIEKLGATMMKLRSERVYHFGKVPAGCVGPDEKSWVSATDQNFLVGEFVHEEDQSRWVMIVNRDMERSHPCVPAFRKAGKMQMVSAYTGTLMEFEGSSGGWAGAGRVVKGGMICGESGYAR
jgi:hypothetical protein